MSDARLDLYKTEIDKQLDLVTASSNSALQILGILIALFTVIASISIDLLMRDFQIFYIYLLLIVIIISLGGLIAGIITAIISLGENTTGMDIKELAKLIRSDTSNELINSKLINIKTKRYKTIFKLTYMVRTTIKYLTLVSVVDIVIVSIMVIVWVCSSFGLI